MDHIIVISTPYGTNFATNMKNSSSKVTLEKGSFPKAKGSEVVKSRSTKHGGWLALRLKNGERSQLVLDRS